MSTKQRKFSARRLKTWAGVGIWLVLVGFLVGLGIFQGLHSTPPAKEPSSLEEYLMLEEYLPLKKCTTHSIKVSESLILNIPANYSQNDWLRCGNSWNEVREKYHTASKALGWEALGTFNFFLPDYSGYTIEKWRNWDQTTLVDVMSITPAKERGFNPNDPAEFERDQFKTLPLADPDGYQDEYGLRCYQGRLEKNHMFCYTPHAGTYHEGMLIDVYVQYGDLAVPNPTMQATYFSKRYGGIYVTWSTSITNLSRWHDIDDQIWRYLTEWNVAPGSQTLPTQASKKLTN